jgi:hypothetical protein
VCGQSGLALVIGFGPAPTASGPWGTPACALRGMRKFCGHGARWPPENGHPRWPALESSWLVRDERWLPAVLLDEPSVSSDDLVSRPHWHCPARITPWRLSAFSGSYGTCRNPNAPAPLFSYRTPPGPRVTRPPRGWKSTPRTAAGGCPGPRTSRRGTTGGVATIRHGGPSLGVVIEQRRSHLRATCVMDARRRTAPQITAEVSFTQFV